MSEHLQLSDCSARRPFAYHKLFGNFAWIDAEMRDLLAAPPPALTLAGLAEHIGPDAAQLLWDSYFLVAAPSEEREAIARALDERRQSVHTGRYLGALQISSSNACNFACTYCFADASDRRSPLRQRGADGPQNITYELAATAIRNVQEIASRNGRTRIGVKFLGREPLINWRVMRALMETFSTEGVEWSVTTNGSLLTPEIAAELRRFDVLTVVSLDGPAPLNDAVRPAKTGGGTYEAVEKGLRVLSDARVPFGVSSVLTAMCDFEAMHGFIGRIAGLGARELELTLVMQTQHAPVSTGPANTDWIENLCDLYDTGRLHGLLVHGDWVDPYHRILATHRFRDEEETVTPIGAACTATSHQISVEPSGDLFPCRAMSTHYGSIFDLEAALHGPEYERVVMRTYHNVPACVGCEVEGFCQGTCLGSSEESTGDVYGIDERYCDVYRAATRALLHRAARRQNV
ncbi:MAG TPA: radical SAM protein [Thermoanaerobaculia bacterium]|nr:radical SAM protein [Thermoanaerobaculia bacterium]